MTAGAIQLFSVLLLSAFFSGMEMAFVSSNRLMAEIDKQNKTLSRRILTKFYNRPNDFISTLLVGNNIALVVYGILMANLTDALLKGTPWLNAPEGVAVAVETMISTLIVLVTGEFLPKTLFKTSPNRMLNIFALPAYMCYIVLYPVSKITSSTARTLLRMVGLKVNKKATEQVFTKTDLDNLIQSGIDSADESQTDNDGVKLFQKALFFSEVKVRDCMVPRTEIAAVEENTSIENLKSLFIETGNSKIIVYKTNIDHIVGFIHSSEMFRRPADWKSNIMETPVVPETMPAQKMLKRFMMEKKSLAVVVDEFGGTSGIVTVEDLVEEIFGEIEDEHDKANYVAQKTGPMEYVLSARLEIEKANRLLHINLPESDEYQTVGGLILQQYQSFPKLNETVRFDNMEFKIIKKSPTRIELVRLTIISGKTKKLS